MSGMGKEKREERRGGANLRFNPLERLGREELATIEAEAERGRGELGNEKGEGPSS